MGEGGKLSEQSGREVTQDLAATRRARELLTVEEMSRADSAAMAAGVTGEALMESAGHGVAQAILERWSRRRVAVLCGPGNNGGDGFVVARHLEEAGWPVALALLGARGKLKGDAAAMAARWKGEVRPLAPEALDGAELVVDAIFGAGLTRPLEGAVRATVEAIGAHGLPCVAVDTPSGVEGDSGRILGAAPRAEITVTFCRRKPGHLLLPGRLHVGSVIVVDIGIPDRAVEGIAPRLHENAPALWLEGYRWPTLADHKYSRGHAIVVGGGAERSGAARMAARAALRVGAGLVTVACPREALPIYAAQQTAVMNAPVDDAPDLNALLEDARRNAVLVGPGCGVSEETRAKTLTALATRRTTVLDADALTVFADAPERLFEAIASPCLLTPHEGEFRRLFRLEGDKVARARGAAELSGAAVLLKGGDTTVAAPDRRAVINANAPPWLATAGAGDVLAGLALGLMAQGMAAFEAGCAAAWLQGEAASQAGPGLIAEDLPEVLPAVLHRLRELALNPFLTNS